MPAHVSAGGRWTFRFVSLFFPGLRFPLDISAGRRRSLFLFSVARKKGVRSLFGDRLDSFSPGDRPVYPFFSALIWHGALDWDFSPGFFSASPGEKEGSGRAGGSRIGGGGFSLFSLAQRRYCFAGSDAFVCHEFCRAFLFQNLPFCVIDQARRWYDK